jgi:phage shock protein B
MKRLGWMVLGALVAVGAYALFESALFSSRVTVVPGRPTIETSNCVVEYEALLSESANPPQPYALGASLQRKAQVGYWNLAFLLVLLALPLGAVLLVIILCGVAARFRGTPRKNGETDQREAALMQDLHRGMTRLEERVESLETILLDRSASAARAREGAGLGGTR